MLHNYKIRGGFINYEKESIECSSRCSYGSFHACNGSECRRENICVATDTTFAPFEFVDDSGEMVGVDMDLLAAIAEDQGFEYEVQPLGFSAAVTALEAKQVDGVIAGMSITDERKEKYDFSEAYYDSGVGMAVHADSDIASYEDLKGETVAVKMGTDGQAFAEGIAEEYGFEIKVMEGSDEMYQDVLVGNSAACFDDYPVLGFEISRGKNLKLPLPMEAGSQYGFAVVKGENAELLEMFNTGLANLKESGKYDEILATYISTEGGEEAETEAATEAE